MRRLILVCDSCPEPRANAVATRETHLCKRHVRKFDKARAESDETPIERRRRLDRERHAANAAPKTPRRYKGTRVYSKETKAKIAARSEAKTWAPRLKALLALVPSSSKEAIGAADLRKASKLGPTNFNKAMRRLVQAGSVKKLGNARWTQYVRAA